MTKTSDMRYGRQGGRFIAPEPKARRVIELPMPAKRSLAAHLFAEHQPIERAVLDSCTPDELATIHTAEHRHRTAPADARLVHAGHLDHTHPDPATAKKGTSR